MNRTLRIFRKDAWCLWPQALVLLALMAMAALRDPLHKHGFISSGGSVAFGGSVFELMAELSPLLAALAGWVLVVSLIQEERLIGHEQYWLTRPYSWKNLIAAKALFLAVFVILPLIVCQFASVAHAGLSPWRWLPALFWRQVFFFVFLVMPAVAMAAVTRHFGQVALAAIGAFALVAAGVFELAQNGVPDWGGYDWMQTSGAALVMAAGMAAAILLQYTRRKTALSRGILAATLALALLLMVYVPVGGAAIAIQSLFSRQAIPDSTLRTSYDASRTGAHPTETSRNSNDPEGVRLEIPLRVEGVPADEPIAVDLTSVAVETPTGAWRSGWLDFQAFHSLSEGKAWLTAFVATEFFERNKDTPVQLSGAVVFTLYRRVGTLAPQRYGVTVSPEAGLCEPRGYIQNSAQLRQATCYSPFSRVAFEPQGRTDTLPLGGSYAPFPTSLGFLPFDRSTWSFRVSYPSDALDLPVAHGQRRFEANGVRLRDYRFH